MVHLRGPGYLGVGITANSANTNGGLRGRAHTHAYALNKVIIQPASLWHRGNEAEGRVM